MQRTVLKRLGVLTVGVVVGFASGAYGQMHSGVHPIPGVVNQIVQAFDNPEGAIFSADGRFVFVTNLVELGSPEGFATTEGGGYISKLAVQPSGELQMVNDKLVTGLTGPLGMGVLPVGTTTFPAGTLFVCSAWAGVQDSAGQGISDPSRLRTKLLAFNEDGQTLGEIDTGQGSIFEELNGSPILIPNALGFDASGNIFVADTALGGGSFEPPFEDKSGVWMIPVGALDDLADGKRPAQLPVFLALPGHPDGVEISPLDGKIYVNTVGAAVGAPDPAGGGIYALTMNNFKTGELPDPIDRDLGALDGLDFTRAGTMLNTQIRGGIPSRITVNCPGKAATTLELQPGGNAAELKGPADIAVRQMADGSHVVVVPELAVGDDTPGDDEVSVIVLPPDFDAACN